MRVTVSDFSVQPKCQRTKPAFVGKQVRNRFCILGGRQAGKAGSE